MKVVILAGGMGSRLSEETQIRPKPMVEIGPYPILWHILRHYSHYGLNDFIICLGYKGYVTYGDGVSDVDLMSLITFHKKTGLAATLTAVRPLGRFGATVLEGARVKSFMEKPECTDWLSPIKELRNGHHQIAKLDVFSSFIIEISRRWTWRSRQDSNL